MAIISCSSADHLNTELQPPNVVNLHLNTVLLPPVNVPTVRINTDLLPPANVANVFHESGITFVSPSVRQLEISSSVQSPSITHAFGFVDTSSNHHQQFVRTHTSQPVSQALESSVSALRSPIGIQINSQIPSNRHEPSTHGFHFNIQPNPTDVQTRNIHSENRAVHQMKDRTHHFEYKVPLPLVRTISQPHQFEKTVRHTIYGLPTQDEINSLPVFQNDKFLSPIVRHTNTPTHAKSTPTAETIESIFDTSFQNNHAGHFS